MKKFTWFSLWLLGMVVSGVMGCSPDRFQTLTIFDSRNRVVALEVIPDAFGGKGYDHPAVFSKESLTRLLKGIRVYQGSVTGRAPLASEMRPAFSDIEIGLLVPHLVKGLQQATPEELVTFFETVEVDDEYELTTSGGIFVAGGNLHLILSNFSVKTQLWQDLDDYDGSYKFRPLEQMEPQPGGIVFQPEQFMVSTPAVDFGSRLKGKPWQVAIRYQDFLKGGQ